MTTPRRRIVICPVCKETCIIIESIVQPHAKAHKARGGGGVTYFPCIGAGRQLYAGYIETHLVRDVRTEDDL